LGVRGANGETRWVTDLPSGANEYHHHDDVYWYHGYDYYHPYWYGDSWYYERVPPPPGVYWDSLPTNYAPVVVNNTTYYADPTEGVYVVGTNNGYQVVEPPAGVETGPDPMQILKSMTEYLAKEKEFTISARETMEEILESGSKAQFESSRVIQVQRPGKVAAKTRSSRVTRNMLFDGGTFTIVDHTQGAYVTLDMPETIDGMLDTAAQQYGLSILLGDLLYSDSYPRLTAAVQDARYVGQSSQPVPSHHLAFSQETVDWEIWIDAGEKPLPRKILLTYKSLPGSPKYEAMVTKWDTSPHPPATFALAIPAGAKLIDVKPLNRKTGEKAN
jgi:hypothetical protein